MHFILFASQNICYAQSICSIHLPHDAYKMNVTSVCVLFLCINFYVPPKVATILNFMFIVLLLFKILYTLFI